MGRPLGGPDSCNRNRRGAGPGIEHLSAALSQKMIESAADHKKLRIAVASSDGKVVNQHFGHAGKFLIFEFDGEKFHFMELRESVPVCNLGTHDEEALSRAADALSDCSYVVASKVGEGAAGALLAKRIRAFVDADFIDKSLEKLLASGKLKHTLGVRPKRFK
jgi:nitrogen fixation protein NifX